MESIVSCLNRSRNVLLATHAGPDGDAIGSLVAMGLALKAVDKQCWLYNESPIPAIYCFLPSVRLIRQTIEPILRFDTAVVLDCGDVNRIGDAAAKINQVPTVINIDHHSTNTGFGHWSLVDPQASATTEIVYRLIQYMKVPITLEIATSIYTGILTDTGSFRFSNTTPAAFQICKEMTEKGVDPYQVAQFVYGTYSLGRIKLLNLALDSIEICGQGKVSVMTVTRQMLNQTGTQPEDVDGLINYARRIEDVRVAALIQEEMQHSSNGQCPCYHVSLRSDGSVDVAAIAKVYGGGGHQSAAGFGIEGHLWEVKSKIARIADRL